MNTKQIIPAAIDAGNDQLKGFIGSLDKKVNIPNVVAPLKKRDYLELESDPLDGLHVEIISGALKEGKNTVAVGNLAMKYDNKDELDTNTTKADDDQPVILLLTALALKAVENATEDVIEVNYTLSTGLPLKESKQGKRKVFKEKLFKNSHQVTFLETPKYKGKTVKINIVDGLVNIEGRSAMIDLTMNEDGSLRNEELTKHYVLIDDIGGLSSDLAVIEPGGSVDNVNSDGIKEGVLPYLDNIIKRVEDTYNYRIGSRRELVEIITNEDPEEKNHIWKKGQRISIQDIVDDELITLAREEYKVIKRVWNKVPKIRYGYQIGGGSIILKEYLEKLNKDDENFPLRFVKKEDSIWMIARAYWKLLMIYLQEKNSEVAAATETE
ncbi:MAG: hypothetical protein ACH0QD_04560 [Tepidibacillus sp.]